MSKDEELLVQDLGKEDFQLKPWNEIRKEDFFLIWNREDEKWESFEVPSYAVFRTTATSMRGRRLFLWR